jgi:hypothetical protein
MKKRKPKHQRGQGKRNPRTPQSKIARVVTTMRSEGLSLRRAAAEEGISPATVLGNAKGALRKDARGRYRARASDRLLRPLVVPSSQGLAEIATRDSRSATIVGEYWNAVNHYLETGDETELARFRGVAITAAQGHAVPLLTDTDELERLGSVGILSFRPFPRSAHAGIRAYRSRP